MSRVYWDTMLFIYLLEGNKQYAQRVEEIYNRMQLRGDSLCISFLGVGEMLAGAHASPQKAQTIRSAVAAMKIRLLPFDAGAVDTFASLRAVQKLATADSIHLACAASAGVDLFLTGDMRLTKQNVAGIQFISSIDTSPI
ncbi:type II toxin-antitoxin system VapC family toxin [Paracidobacterium acidisoli]|uniref:PIN domain-containing protein n=1 Tax=Paracidobacterium acidisoli TaxID=2303751 RepID=A0A372IPR9_9BACT|nr:PIN domain-containing protein [Paracidobacterium acidisoli]MBT9331283.1 PIN domain-containing protein [Paracidobacterium acidisoli]